MHLDLKTMLPVIRKAYDAGELEAQKSSGNTSCHYAGPCAIGVCLPEDTRVSLDTLHEDGGGTSVGKWFYRGVLSCPPDQRDDWEVLQLEHDNWTSSKEDYFGILLKKLERKYDAGTSAQDSR
jgi:hypothetical protein